MLIRLAVIPGNVDESSYFTSSSSNLNIFNPLAANVAGS